LSGVRSWEETMQRIDAGWPKKQLDLRQAGWAFDPIQKLWAHR